MALYKPREPAPIELGWFKSLKSRNAGRDQVVQYHAIRSNGTIKTVDITRISIKINVGFGSQPVSDVVKIKSKEFQKALNQVLELKKNY